MGSVGNLAQTVIVAESSREKINENAGTSNETLDNDEDYESEGHYEVVDKNRLGDQESQNADDVKNTNNPGQPPVEPIYAKVNKNRKLQVRGYRSIYVFTCMCWKLCNILIFS